jgi:hypothetical protein
MRDLTTIKHLTFVYYSSIHLLLGEAVFEPKFVIKLGFQALIKNFGIASADLNRRSFSKTLLARFKRASGEVAETSPA